MMFILCVASVASSCLCCSVGAVNVAPSMTSNRSFVNDVQKLNSKLENLSNNLKKLKDKVEVVRDTCSVREGEQVIIKNENMYRKFCDLYQDIHKFEKYVNEVKGTSGVNDEAGILALNTYMDMLLKKINAYLNYSDIDLFYQSDSIGKDMVGYEKKLKDIVPNMINRNFRANNNIIINNVNSNINNDSMQREVQELNLRLNNLSNNIQKLKDRLKARGLSADTAFLKLLNFEKYVNEVKGTSGVNNEDGVVYLQVLVSIISRNLEQYLKCDDNSLANKCSNIINDLDFADRRMKETVPCMTNSEYRLSRINRGRNHNNNVNNNIINNNVNNGNNIRIDLNDNNIPILVDRFMTIRDVVSELNSEENIFEREHFLQTGDFNRAVKKFDLAFDGSKIDYRKGGIYTKIAKKFYKYDLNAQGKYIGKYSILSELHDAFQELCDTYVFGNDCLSQVEFRNKVKQNAAKVNSILDKVVDWLGLA